MNKSTKIQRELDQRVTIHDPTYANALDDSLLIGNWFVFYKAGWKQKISQLEQTKSKKTPKNDEAQILYRGEETLFLPGAEVKPTPLPTPTLVSLTCDKALYRAGKDTVRLLIAAPQHQQADLKLALKLNGQPYAEYPLTLDEYGLSLWSMQDLPEGNYEAQLRDPESDICRFEVAEYRLAPLNAELIEQQLQESTLTYGLSVTSFGQPYRGPIEVELQELGQRIGKRQKLTCDQNGHCMGSVTLTGTGPYTLSIFAQERTATVALKGSEQERREVLAVNNLGRTHELSLLPLPDADHCRGMYIAEGSSNNAPFLVRNIIGKELEIEVRKDVSLLRAVIVSPTQGSSEEQVHQQLRAGQSVRIQVPNPYGIVLLGAFVDNEAQAWEGWCAALSPSDLQLQCEAPRQARPGARINVTLRTNVPDRVVPVQLIVKDQRLIAPSDPQVEFAAGIKKNLTTWSTYCISGDIRPLSAFESFYGGEFLYRRARPFAPGGFPLPPPSMTPTGALPPPMSASPNILSAFAGPVAASAQAAGRVRMAYERPQAQVAQKAAPTTQLTRVRMQFPEVIYNNIVKVQGETTIEIKLGDSMTRYSIEAFALDTQQLDWQRSETTLEATQPVYAELTVSPFVFPGDPVMGRLDVGASSGEAEVEVRLDGDLLPLFYEDGTLLPAGKTVASGTVVRFPVRPGQITASVRDTGTGEADVSERYVTEPGKLRHVVRRMHLMTPGESVTLQAPMLELKPLPGLERPFQFFVEGAAKYPFG